LCLLLITDTVSRMNKLQRYVQQAVKPTTVFESLVMTLALVATAEDLRDFAEAEKMAFECAELLTDEEVTRALAIVEAMEAQEEFSI
jgi:hypothetical protein